MLRLSSILLLVGTTLAGFACDSPTEPLVGPVARAGAPPLPNDCTPFEHTCASDEVCVFSLVRARFECIATGVQGGMLLDPCTEVYDCNYGYACVLSEETYFSKCEEDACCTPYCDNNHECPEDFGCFGFYDDPEPPGANGIGVCVGNIKP